MVCADNNGVLLDRLVLDIAMDWGHWRVSRPLLIAFVVYVALPAVIVLSIGYAIEQLLTL